MVAGLLVCTVPAAAAAATASVSGTVISATAKTPIKGTRVCAFPAEPGPGSGCTQTDANGEYTIANLTAGGYRIEFSGGGDYVRQYFSQKSLYSEATIVHLAAGESRTGVNASMEAGARLSGTVTSATTKAGIAGASVCARPAVPELSGECATTAGDGSYTIEGLAAGTYTVEFSSGENYAPQYYHERKASGEADQVTVEAGETKLGIDAALQVGGRFTGTVKSAATQAGLSGVSVCARPAGSIAGPACAVTGPSGEYTISKMSATQYTVEFSGGGNYVRQYYSGKATLAEAQVIAVAAGQIVTNINASLEAGGQITGHVRAAGTLEATSGVEACARGAEAGACATTNAAGEYSIGGLRTGKYTVEFFGGGDYVRQFYNDKGPAEPDQVTVTAGATTTEINATMETGAEISGHLTSAASSEPVQGTVCALKGSEPFCASTGEHGAYSVIGLPAGSYKVEFFPSAGNYARQYYNGKASFAEATPVSLTAAQMLTGIDAALAPGGQISGTVTSAATKAALGGASVCARREAEQECATTNSKGEYTISRLAAGNFKVEFSRGSFTAQYYMGKNTEQEADSVAVSAGAKTANIDAALQPYGEISGTVTDHHTQQPVEHAAVTVYGAAGTPIAYTTTNAAGEYTVSGLSPGNYKVGFTAEGHLAAFYKNRSTLGEADLVSVSGEHTTPDVGAELVRAASIEGTVTSAHTKAPVSGISVVVLTSGGQGVAFTQTDGEGHYHVSTLPPGEYKVQFAKGTSGVEYITQYYSGKRTLQEATGIPLGPEEAATGVNAEMVVAGKVHGTVTAAHTKAAVEGVDVCAYAGSPGALAGCAVTGPTGEYTLGGLAEGSYEIAYYPGFASGNLLSQWYNGETTFASADPVSVVAEATKTEVNAVLQTGGTIAGVTTKAGTGSPLEGIEICAYPLNGSTPTECAESSAHGEYSITGLRAGQYVVEFFGSTVSGQLLTQYYKAAYTRASAEPVTVAEESITPEIDAAMTEGGSIAGAVTSASSSEPLSGIEVCARGTAAPAVCAQTDTSGDYLLAGLSAGSYVVSFRGTSNGIEYATQYYDAKSTEGEANEVVINADETVPHIDAAMVNISPENGKPPKIEGEAKEGAVLKEVHGTWSKPIAEYKYQWEQCDPIGEGCLPIPKAHGETYVPTNEDVGHEIRVQETVVDTEGASGGPATSAPTAAIGAAVPENIHLPTIAGTAQQAATLSEQPGSWSGEPTEFEYQWLKCDTAGEQCTEIANATGQKYIPAEGDVGARLRVRETVANRSGHSKPATSAATAEVLPLAPVNKGQPKITGLPARQDGALGVEVGSWEHNPTEYTYQWLRCTSLGTPCTEIEHATQASYTPRGADVGGQLRVEVTAHNAGGPSEPGQSEPSGIVAGNPPVVEHPPTIAGAARQGATLTEHHGVWTNEPSAFEYAWMRCSKTGGECHAIPEATEATYNPIPADVGHELRVQETALNETVPSLPAASLPTAPIEAAQPEEVTPPSIVGAAAVGGALVIEPGTWTVPPTSVAFQWMRCDLGGGGCQAIAGATGDAYSVALADIHHRIVLRETAYSGATPSPPAFSKPTAAVTAPPLHASAGENLTATVNQPVQFDGSGSTPANQISAYKWDFGDGSSGEGATPHHVYASPGTYRATLTVERENETASAWVTVTVDEAGAKVVTISAESATGNPLAGTELVYVAPDGSRISATTGPSGSATMAGLPDGSDAVYAYHTDFSPATGTVAVSGGTGTATIVLHEGQLATTALQSKQLTPQEAAAAGIDINDPANHVVTEFSAHLAFGPGGCNPTLQGYVNGRGEFVGNTGGSCISSCASSSCTGGGGTIDVFPAIVDNHPVLEWIVLDGQVSFLKQFFRLSLLVQNLSPEPFRFTNGQATLSLEPGLSLAPTATAQTLTQGIEDIPGGGSASAVWLVRGDTPGEYRPSVTYSAHLQPFDTPFVLPAALKLPLTVVGAEALKITVDADEHATADYPYHLRIGLTNTSTVPVYNARIALDGENREHFIYQPEQLLEREFAEIAPGQTVHTEELILVPTISGTLEVGQSFIAEIAGSSQQEGTVVSHPTPTNEHTVTVAATYGELTLKWDAIPEASGYRVYSTPDPNSSPFGGALTVHEPSGGKLGPPTTEVSGTTATILTTTPGQGHWYAVSAIVKGIPTLYHPIVFATEPPPPQPVNTQPPVVTGASTVGSQLSCSTGTWTGEPPLSFTYSWLRDGKRVSGPNAGSTYTLVQADSGHELTCQVTATNKAGSTTATSQALRVALTLAVFPLQARVGESFSTTMAFIAAPAGTSGLRASIDWGDGSGPQPGVVAAAPVALVHALSGEAGFEVRATHTYQTSNVSQIRVTVTSNRYPPVSGTAAALVQPSDPTAYFLANPNPAHQNGIGLLMPATPSPGQRNIRQYRWEILDGHPVIDSASTRPQYDSALIHLAIEPGNHDVRQQAINLGILPEDANGGPFGIGGLSEDQVRQVVGIWKDYFPYHIVPHLFDYWGKVGVRLTITDEDGATSQYTENLTVTHDCPNWPGPLGAIFKGTICDTVNGFAEQFGPHRKPDYAAFDVTPFAGELGQAATFGRGGALGYGLAGGVSLVVTRDASVAGDRAVFAAVHIDGLVGAHAGYTTGSPLTLGLVAGWLGGPQPGNDPSPGETDNFVEGTDLSAGAVLELNVSNVGIGGGFRAVENPNMSGPRLDGNVGEELNVFVKPPSGGFSLSVGIGGVVDITCAAPISVLSAGARSLAQHVYNTWGVQSPPTNAGQLGSDLLALYNAIGPETVAQALGAALVHCNPIP